jgi:beta-phosphoglucomutase-like phosphatase (HAD superfamily)
MPTDSHKHPRLPFDPDANDSNIYESTAATLGVPPGECVVVEDTVRGLEAARAAGCRVVVTYTRATKTDVGRGAGGACVCIFA